MTAPASGAGTRFNLRALLEEMIERDASDLHIVAGERPKLRVDGDITNASVEDVLTPKDTLTLAYSVLTENQKKRFETDNELDFSFGIQNLARFRGNCFKQRGCVSLVIRQIPFSVKTFDDLGLPQVVAKMAAIKAKYSSPMKPPKNKPINAPITVPRITAIERFTKLMP